jgi:hypothetical protein
MSFAVAEELCSAFKGALMFTPKGPSGFARTVVVGTILVAAVLIYALSFGPWLCISDHVPEWMQRAGSIWYLPAESFAQSGRPGWLARAFCRYLDWCTDGGWALAPYRHVTA